MAPRRVWRRIKQDPDPPSRWARRASILLGQTPVQICCLADVGSIAVSAPPTEDLNEAFHGINFAGAVAVVVDPTERRNSEVRGSSSADHRKFATLLKTAFKSIAKDLHRFRVDQHRHQQRRLLALVHPRMVGPALDHDVERL